MAPGFDWIRKITDDAELMDEILPGESVIELVGEGRVLVEGHRGVSAYSDSSICIKAKDRVIEITGCNLKLTQMDACKLVISGRIMSINLIRG